MEAVQSSPAVAAARPARKIDWVGASPFFAIHLLAFGTIWTGITPAAAICCAVLYVVRMFAVTGGYHRYFSHRTYRTSRVFQFFLAFLAQTSAQRGALWWAAHHRHHHRYSDMANDTHSVAPGRLLVFARAVDLREGQPEDRPEVHPGSGPLPRAALPRQVLPAAADHAGHGDLLHARRFGPVLRVLRQHRAALARHLHDQLAVARVRQSPLQDHR